jgi:peroxiredoxin
MKKFFYSVISALLFVSCSNNQNSKGYSILGTVPADIVGKIYLQRFEDKQYTTVDSAEIANGIFTFAGSVTEPMVYAIVPSQKSQRAPVFLDNHPLQITLDDEWEIKDLKGSENSELFHRLLPQSRQGTLNIDTLVRNHPSSPVAAYFLTRELYKYDYEALKKLRSQFSDSLSNHPYIKSIDRTLASLENVQPGKPAPDFTLASANGDSISLSSLRGKYVLVDFWASWCPDCRKTNPQLVALFQKYKDKNFTLLSVSIDEDPDRWKAAIEKDGLVWSQVIDVKGWQSEVAKTYAVQWIPTGILIDPQGIILARSTEPASLEKELERILNPR